MKHWKTQPLGDWPLAIIDGDRSARYPKREEFTNSGVPFLNSTNFTNDRIDTSELNYVSVEKATKITKGKVRAGDIVMTTRGSIGKVALYPKQLPEGLINAQMLIIRADGERLNPRFLFHVLRSPIFQKKLYNFSSGSAQPQIPIRDLKHVPIMAPDIRLQHRIADILSAYDDLIEVNTRRIAILEEMARRLFEEWFTKFRFPGHDAVSLQETEGLAVPSGWILGVVGTLAGYINRGIAPQYDDAAPQLVINQKCIRSGRLNLGLTRKQSRAVPEAKFVRRFDVLVNSTGVGTLGRVAQTFAVPAETTVDTHVTIIRARPETDPYFFGIQLIALEETFANAGVGSTGQTELGRSVISEMKVLVPPQELQQKFGRLAGPIREQAEMLVAQNGLLRAARDLLLPKLISGEIDLARAERGLETDSERVAAE
jgi:type I restriction enzyme S subunit